MSSCREIEPALTRVADGEAGQAEVAAVEAHLAGCPSCRSVLEVSRGVRDLVRSRAEQLRGSAPGALRARCAAQVPGPRAGPWRREVLVGLSVAATLIVAVVGLVVWGLVGGAPVLASQLTLDHQRCFDSEPAVGPSDLEAIERDWARREGWRPVIPPGVVQAGLELKDVRRCQLDGGGMAHALYRSHGERTSLFVAPRHEDGNPAIMAEAAVVDTWTAGTLRYYLVTDERGPRRAELRRLLQRNGP